MASISELSGITGSTLELFKAAGFVTVDSLLGGSVSEILKKLEETNRAYQIPVRLPSPVMVKEWQNAARELEPERAPAEVVDRPAGAKREAALPAATLISEEQLRSAGIEVEGVPVAKAREGAPAKPGSAPKRTTPAGSGGGSTPVKPASLAAAAGEGVGVGQESRKATPRVERKASTAARAEAKGKAAPRSSAQAGSQSEMLLPAAPPSREEVSRKAFKQLEEVQAKKPSFERRNRGMSHPDAVRVRVAAVVTILAPLFAFTTALALAVALFLARFHGWEFHWTIALLLLVFPVCLIFYLSVATKARCRLCGQPLFVPRHCRKHERARRSIFGYTFAVARDAMLFAGYRCMLCGTKTRLKD